VAQKENIDGSKTLEYSIIVKGAWMVLFDHSGE